MDKIQKHNIYTHSEAFMLNDQLKKYTDIDNYNKICSLSLAARRTGGKELKELCDNMIDDINDAL